MQGLVEVGLGNALMATALAVAAAGVGAIVRRRPALVHGLWVLVLLRLLAPPLLSVPVAPPSILSPPPRPSPAPPAAPLTPLPVAPISPTTRPAPAPPLPAVLAPAVVRPVEAESQVVEWQGVAPMDPRPLAGPDRPRTVPTGPENGGPAGLETAAAAPEITSAPPAASRPAGPVSRGWTRAVGVVWLAGSLAWVGCVAVRVRRFQRALRWALPAPEAVRRRAEGLAGRLGLARAPGVWIVPGTVAPLVWGFGRRARLIVPATLWSRLDDDQRDALLLHELAHLRRGDPWVRLLELAATGLYWWHSVVWWARRALREAEEQCCDAWVVWATGPGSGRAYATALVEAVDFLSEARPALPPSASGMSRVRHLTRRIVMIMKGTTPRALSWAGLLALIALGALSLTWLPTWAQPGGSPPAGSGAASEAANGRGMPSMIIGESYVPGPRPAGGAADGQEVAILKAQLAQKQAALQRAEAARTLALAKFQRLRNLEATRPGTLARGEMEEARIAIEIADADIAECRAEVQEYEIRLRGAQARQSAPQPTEAPLEPSRPTPAARPDGGPAAALPDTVPASEAPDHRAVEDLKQIGLALHNFISVRGHLPPPTIVAADGSPLLSWRVAILPFLGHNDLYNRFALDEPWDSPHNLALLAEMPAVYGVPGRDPGTPGLTYRVALVGPETVWGKPEGVTLAEITDGTSNTLAVVEATFPVPWTKPEDVTYRAARYHEGGPGMDHGGLDLPPVPPLGEPGSRQTLALYLDGSVKMLTKPLNPLIFHALATRAGGEVVSEDQKGQPIAATTGPRGMSGMMMGGPRGMAGMMPGDPGMTTTHGAPAPPGTAALPDNAAAPTGLPGMAGMMAGMGGYPEMPGMAGAMKVMMGGMAGTPPPSDRDRRLDELEQKFDRLLKEMEALRGSPRQAEKAGPSEALFDGLTIEPPSPAPDEAEANEWSITLPLPAAIEFEPGSPPPADEGVSPSQAEISPEADVILEVSGDRRRLDVGQPIVFKLNVHNAGAEDARQVEVEAQLSDNLKPVETTGTEQGARMDEATNTVQFPPIDRLEAGKQMTLLIKVEAAKEGPATCRAFVTHEGIEHEIEDLATARVVRPGEK